MKRVLLVAVLVFFVLIVFHQASFAADGTPSPSNSDPSWWHWLAAAGSTIAGIFGVSSWRERARKLEAKVIAASKGAAHAIGNAVQKGVIFGADALKRWDGLFEAWALKECGKLPEPLKTIATKAAQGVFQELHVYAAQAEHKAAAELEVALRSFADRVHSFEQALPELDAKIAKFPGATPPPLAPAPGGDK